MRKAMEESTRRRKIQLAYNRQHKITPKGIQKAIHDSIEIYLSQEQQIKERLDLEEEQLQVQELLDLLEKEMFLAAKNLHFEKAAQLRDQIKEIKEGFKGKINVRKNNKAKYSKLNK